MKKKKSFIPAMLFVKGNLCEISEKWVANLSRDDVLKYALANFKMLDYINSSDYSAWYSAGVLNAVDAAQDMKTVDGVGRGLELLQQNFPVATRFARRKADKIAAKREKRTK